MDSEPQLDIDVGKDSDKFALFKKIQEHKGILFGKFSPNVTKESKEETWNQIRAELIHDGHEFFREKTTKQIRDSIWSLSKTRTIKKYDNAKKTGMGKIAKFTELEKLVLAIVAPTPSKRQLQAPLHPSAMICVHFVNFVMFFSQ